MKSHSFISSKSVLRNDDDIFNQLGVEFQMVMYLGQMGSKQVGPRQCSLLQIRLDKCAKNN